MNKKQQKRKRAAQNPPTKAQANDGHQKSNFANPPYAQPLNSTLYRPSQAAETKNAQSAAARVHNENVEALVAALKADPQAGNGARAKLPRATARARAPSIRKQFLEQYRLLPVITVAARSVGVTRQTILEWRQKYPDFDRQVLQAEQEGIDVFEAHGILRGGRGVKKPVFMNTKNGPVIAGEITEYSDKIWSHVMSAKRAQQYGKQALELSGPNGAPLQPLVAPTQVQIIIPSNGREGQAQPAITVPSTATPLQNESKTAQQITQGAQAQSSTDSAQGPQAK